MLASLGEGPSKIAEWAFSSKEEMEETDLAEQSKQGAVIVLTSKADL